MDQMTEFAGNHPQLFIALGVIIAMLAYSYLRSAMQGFGAVGPQEATQLINHEGALVVDVREASEMAEGRIMDCLHIPLGQFDSQVDRLEKYRETPVIVSCRTGSRSVAACTTLVRKGFARVYNLRGGIVAWRNADLPLTKGKD